MPVCGMAKGGGGMHAQVTPDASRTKHHSIAGDAGGTRLQCVAACFMAACACRWAASSPGWCMHARRGPHLELQALGAHIVLVDALEAGGAGLGLSIKRGCKVEGVRWQDGREAVNQRPRSAPASSRRTATCRKRCTAISAAAGLRSAFGSVVGDGGTVLWRSCRRTIAACR